MNGGPERCCQLPLAATLHLRGSNNQTARAAELFNMTQCGAGRSSACGASVSTAPSLLPPPPPSCLPPGARATYLGRGALERAPAAAEAHGRDGTVRPPLCLEDRTTF
eukprot:2060844-Pleurochrysis_carterae.AAC.3